MEAFNEWWGGLSLVLKVYWGVAIPFTVFFLLQLVTSFIGVDSPDDLPSSDAEIEADQGAGFQFFTLKNLVGFFTLFGWTGIASINAGASVLVSMVAATVAGAAMMGLMGGLFYLLSKAVADGTMNIEQAVGQTAEVYLVIQGARGGMGKIQVKVSGALRTLDAMTDDAADIPTGKLVKVSKVIGDNILLVTLL